MHYLVSEDFVNNNNNNIVDVDIDLCIVPPMLSLFISYAGKTFIIHCLAYTYLLSQFHTWEKKEERMKEEGNEYYKPKILL